MANLSLIGASVTASGHPGACGSVASGVLAGDSSVTVNGTPVGIATDCSLDFGSHGHDTDSEGACISYMSHSVQQESVSSSVSVNGKAVYVEVSGAATDPGSGGPIDYTSSGGNGSVTTTL